MKKAIRYAAGILLFFFFLLLISLLITAVRSAMSAETNVLILAEYPEKIVYAADPNADIALLEKDCKKRNGKFNPCGSPCSPRAQMCVSVCAFTCELEKK